MTKKRAHLWLILALIFALVAVGVLLGGISSWLKQHRWRARARRAGPRCMPCIVAHCRNPLRMLAGRRHPQHRPARFTGETDWRVQMTMSFSICHEHAACLDVRMPRCMAAGAVLCAINVLT